MLASSGLKERAGLCLLVTFFAVSNVRSQLTSFSSISCPNSQSLCGGSVCYDPATQFCTKLGKVVQCMRICGSQCYNPNTQQCFNGTLCSLSEQLCVVKYEVWYGYEYNPPSYRCYNPTYSACLNNSLCDYPSQSCNQRCLRDNEVCINNMTVCNVKDRYDYYQAGRVESCNGMCYDSATQQCINGTIQCINNCSRVCYNSSSHQCFNGTLCSLNQQLCLVKYGSGSGYDYNPPSYQCYNPTYSVCLNNSLCDYPSRLCNQRCLRYNQACVNNVTVCNFTNRYYYYQAGRVESCNGMCYDSATQQCINGTIQCINNCSRVCYNSSSHQCFNGTLCSLSEQLCIVKYDSGSGYKYNPPSFQCYNPTYSVCLNNSLCGYPSGLCNQRCLRYNQACVNNVTICNVTNSYYYYRTSRVESCNDICYDSAIHQCINGTIQCINNCSG
ncbi:unnamed protein product, partial [Rotaria sordida]